MVIGKGETTATSSYQIKYEKGGLDDDRSDGRYRVLSFYSLCNCYFHQTYVGGIDYGMVS